MSLFSSNRRGSGGRSQTQSARTVEDLIDGAESDMRAPGNYRQLGRAVEAVVGDDILEKAGTFGHAHPNDRAEEVMNLLEQELVVVFSGPTPDGDDRSFVVGDSRQDIQAVLIPVEPIPMAGEGATRILIVSDATTDRPQNPWSAEEAQIGLSKAIVDLATPEQSGAEEEIDYLKEQLDQTRQENAELEAKVGELKDQIQPLEE